MTTDTRTPKLFIYSGTLIPELRARDGQVVTVVRELGDDERDREVGRMFRVRFADGFEHDVFADELARAAIAKAEGRDCRGGGDGPED